MKDVVALLDSLNEGECFKDGDTQILFEIQEEGFDLETLIPGVLYGLRDLKAGSDPQEENDDI